MTVKQPFDATSMNAGLLVGLIVGEGHFGGDGRQPQITLRMHTDHEALFRWIERTFPGGKVYGPYEHGGRRYFQWMARGAFLRETLIPILDEVLTASFDEKAERRYAAMKVKYRIGGPTLGASIPPGSSRMAALPSPRAQPEPLVPPDRLTSAVESTPIPARSVRESVEEP